MQTLEAAYLFPVPLFSDQSVTLMRFSEKMKNIYDPGRRGGYDRGISAEGCQKIFNYFSTKMAQGKI